MAAPAQRAASSINWTALTSSLGLKGASSTSLLSFKKRTEDARRRLAALQDQPTTLDLSQYRSTLKNQAVIDDLEKILKEFKPKTYDVGKQTALIAEFEKKAVKSAEETRELVRRELKGLEEALGNIRDARPVSELTADDVMTARKDVEEKMEMLIKKGQWNVPGYNEKFGNTSVL